MKKMSVLCCPWLLAIALIVAPGCGGEDEATDDSTTTSENTTPTNNENADENADEANDELVLVKLELPGMT